MPLSPATGREPIHTRKVTCAAYHRADDLIDIEGHLTDVKNYPVPNTWRGELAPGTPIHDMWLRLTIDHDFVIQDVEAVTDASPFQVCPAVTVNFQRLKGCGSVPVGARWFTKSSAGSRAAPIWLNYSGQWRRPPIRRPGALKRANVGTKNGAPKTNRVAISHRVC